jgi:hypothetical protein
MEDSFTASDVEGKVTKKTTFVFLPDHSGRVNENPAALPTRPIDR